MFLVENFSDLKSQIRLAREPAYAEAAAQYKWFRSRGMFLCTATESREQCNPAPEASAPFWNGTWKSVKSLVELVEKQDTNVGEIYIAGGYDGADSHQNLWIYQNYEPSISSWSVLVWKRS